MVSAEILKLRKRWATYIVPLVGIVLMGLIYLLVGSQARGQNVDLITRFPGAYGTIDSVVFGLGSLLALAYSAAVGGADWSWGIIRVVIARGEGRGRYVIGKALGLAVVLAVGTLVVLASGIAFDYMAAALAGRSAGNAFSADGIAALARSIAYGLLVLWERCFIGFAVAFLLRSQLAGVVVGIVLYIGENLLSTVLTFLTFAGNNANGGGGLGRTIGTQWYQFLPFSIGNSLLGYAASSPQDQIGAGALLTPVSLQASLAMTAVYLLIALAIAVIVTKRAEIRS